MSFAGRIALTLTLMGCLLTGAKAATPLQKLTFKDNLYYLNNHLYTGDVTLKTSNGISLVYNALTKEGKRVRIRRWSVLEFTGSVKNGRRDGRWITTYPLDFSDIKIVENYDNGKLKSIHVYRKTPRDRVLKPYIEGKLTNHSNHWQWKVYSRSIFKSITYSGQTIGVMPQSKATSFFSKNGRDYTKLNYIDKTKANLKFQIFHIILHKKKFGEDDSTNLKEGPDELIRDGRWEVTNQQGQLYYAKDYIYGRKPSTYNAVLEYNEDGTSDFSGFWEQDNGHRKREEITYDAQGNILDYQLVDPKHAIKRDEKYYPNGHLQHVHLLINNNKNYVVLEYYPTGELFKQRIFKSIPEFSDLLGFSTYHRKQVGNMLIYNRQGQLINAPSKPASLTFNNPKRLNQQTVRELLHDPK